MAAAGGESMMTREQLLHLFSRFSFLTSLPEIKQRIADAVRDKQEAVAVTTEIQEEILHEMGVGTQIAFCLKGFPLAVAFKHVPVDNDEDPSFGIGCLGKVNVIYENDMDLMIKFYQFVAKEEMAIDEAELEPRELAEKLHAQQILQEQQLNMLVEMRKYSPESQSVILETLHRELEEANFDINASILNPEQIHETAQKGYVSNR